MHLYVRGWSLDLLAAADQEVQDNTKAGDEDRDEKPDDLVGADKFRLEDIDYGPEPETDADQACETIHHNEQNQSVFHENLPVRC